MLKVVSSVGGGGGGISGSGTTNYLPKFASSTSLGDSKLLQAGTTILTQRSAAPAIFSTPNGTLSASALCTGYVLLNANTLSSTTTISIFLPTGSAIDTQLALSGATPTNVTFDCTFYWNYSNDTGNFLFISGNTGNEAFSGGYFDDVPPGTIAYTDYGSKVLALRFYRLGSASYYWYPITY